MRLEVKRGGASVSRAGAQCASPGAKSLPALSKQQNTPLIQYICKNNPYYGYGFFPHQVWCET